MCVGITQCGNVRIRLLALFLLLPSLASAQKDEAWLEVRSPNFTVISNAGDKRARRVAEEFELFRAVIQSALPRIKLDPGQPVIIFAVKDENSLKRLLPEFWEVKGRMHPAGYFQPGPEKHYAALRIDASGENPFQVVYHEYVHLLVEVNWDFVPLWLNEGLAEFYANAVFSGSQVGIGRPSEYHLYMLSERKPLPLAELLTVDHNSPHYNEGNRASVFYAQSWALTHYLMLADRAAHFKQLNHYLELVQKGTPEREAAVAAFGDLKKFEKTLRDYATMKRFFYIPVKPPQNIDEKQFPARPLSPAEGAAMLGDFYVHTRRLKEARASLEQAMALDPGLAAPRESMGILAYRQGDRADAGRWFQEALQRDSQSFLAHYFHAMLSFEGRASSNPLDTKFESIEADLRRTVELRPNFAPAHAMLAQFYALKQERLPEALEHAKRATQLDPRTLSHHLSLASVLLSMGREEEARTLAQRVLASAKNPEERMQAESFLEHIEARAAFEADRKRYEEERKQYDEQMKKERAPREAREREDAAAGGMPAGQSGAASPAPVVVRGPKVDGEGVVSQVSCDGPNLNLTLTLAGLDMKLHAPNYWKIEFTSTRWTPPRDFNPCVHLKGRDVQLQYHTVVGQPYAGVLVSVEIRK